MIPKNIHDQNDEDDPDAADWTLAQAAYHALYTCECRKGGVWTELLNALEPYRWYLDAEPNEQ